MPLGTTALAPEQWTLDQSGTSGVNAQQLAVVTETTAIIFDKVEDNPLSIGGHPAWAAELNLDTMHIRPLAALTSTWCATGGFLGNGTFINSGGSQKDTVGGDGLRGIRLFEPSEDQSCELLEDPEHLHLTSPRWYPSSVRIEDGSIMVWGGSILNAFMNNLTIHNPTYEFYPPKNIHGYNGLKIPSPFLVDTLNGNYFPILFQLSDGKLFVAANQKAMLFDWRSNTETRLLNIPNGARVTSPFSAGAVLLPLTPENNYTPEVILCGGSNISDTMDPWEMSSQSPVSDQCVRMVLTEEGTRKGWSVERMPYGTIMPDMILLPDGRIFIVNGAHTGLAGYGNVHDQIGASNADHPALQPVIYDPSAPAGQRFSTVGIPATDIPRMYHSTASLTPNGNVLVAGSNPNGWVSTETYHTEYRIEFYNPPYMTRHRPSYLGLPARIDYGTNFTLAVTLHSDVNRVTVSLMDLGFSTHGVHMDQRLVRLRSTLSEDNTTLTVTSPPAAQVYPPGPAFLYVVTDDGVPSFGHKIIIGMGEYPPVDQAAIFNVLNDTPYPSSA